MANNKPQLYSSDNSVETSESGAPSTGRAVRDIFSTDEIFHRITATADEEFSRSTRLLFFSGLAGGLSIALSFLASAALSAKFPGENTLLIGGLLYPLGFIFIVVGRYQLFTENTLTPVTLVLTRIGSIPLLLKVWGTVLGANLLGAALMALVLAKTGVFPPETMAAAQHLGEHAMAPAWKDLFWKGIFAGWIVAGMVWLNHAARDTASRILITFILIYTVAVADLSHCIVGASEVLFLVFKGHTSFGTFVFDYFTPVVLGNTAGGVMLVAILNYTQTRNKRFPDRDCGQLELNWMEWLFGRHSGIPELLNDTPDIGASKNKKEKVSTPSVNEKDHIQGNKEAPVTLMQYGDYECPTSLKIYTLIEELLEQKSEEVRFVYRHLPLSSKHPHATHAARAAEAAARQGKFWEMHKKLFNNQNRLEDEQLLQYAKDLKLDADQLQRDMDSEEIKKKVESNRRSGVKSEVKGTNNLFINGKRYRGEMTLKEITSHVSGKSEPA